MSTKLQETTSYFCQIIDIRFKYSVGFEQGVSMVNKWPNVDGYQLTTLEI